MTDQLISIIVPVYNAEKYLRKCLDSIVSQTYPSLEILLVDDGSTDNSLNICENYAAKDPRIIVIHQENSGVSQARNNALSKASGELFMFVDGDDWIDLNTCQIAVDAMLKDDADIVMWSYMREFGDHSAEKIIYPEDKLFADPEEIKELHRRFVGASGKDLARPENADALCTVWGKLYKKEFVQYKFTDLSEIGTYEDGFFNLQAFQNICKAVFLNKALYHYRKDNSSSQTTSYNPNLYPRWCNLFDRMQNYISANTLDQTYQRALNNRIALSILGLGLNITAAPASFALKCKHLKEITSSDRYQKAYSQLEFKYFPIHWKLFYWSAKKNLSFITLALCKVINIIR